MSVDWLIFLADLSTLCFLRPKPLGQSIYMGKPIVHRIVTYNSSKMFRGHTYAHTHTTDLSHICVWHTLNALHGVFIRSSGSQMNEQGARTTILILMLFD